MQKDMHFWGTYVIARAAGVPSNDAHTIVYAAQYVDDSTKQDSKTHEDGGCSMELQLHTILNKPLKTIYTIERSNGESGCRFTLFLVAKVKL